MDFRPLGDGMSCVAVAMAHNCPCGRSRLKGRRGWGRMLRQSCAAYKAASSGRCRSQGRPPINYVFATLWHDVCEAQRWLGPLARSESGMRRCGAKTLGEGLEARATTRRGGFCCRSPAAGGREGEGKEEEEAQ